MGLSDVLPIARAFAFVAALSACPWTWATPEDDTVQAEAALRNGDLISAMALLRRAADGGHAPAQARLGDLLDAAEFDAEAVVLYRKAAAQNHPAGEVGLARMLAVGEGVARDSAQALALLRKAAERNYAPAFERLSSAYRTGDLGLPRDPAEAKRLADRAKALRDAAAAAAKDKS